MTNKKPTTFGDMWNHKTANALEDRARIWQQMLVNAAAASIFWQEVGRGRPTCPAAIDRLAAGRRKGSKSAKKTFEKSGK